jgi:hypothetical protein
MKRIALILNLAFWTLNSYSQTSFGFQIETGISKLVGISTDSINYGAGFSQVNKINISPSFRVRKPLSNRINIELGIGYLPISHSIQLNYNDPFPTSTLNINSHYLTIPIGLGYTLPVSKNSSFVAGLELNTGILLDASDNYQDIIFYDIALRRKWYSKVVLNPLLFISYQNQLNHRDKIEFGFFISRSVNAFVQEDKAWGFYHNLVSSRILRYGVQLKYFFNS